MDFILYILCNLLDLPHIKSLFCRWQNQSNCPATWFILFHSLFALQSLEIPQCSPCMLHPDFSELLGHIQRDFAPWAAKWITGLEPLPMAPLCFPKGPSQLEVYRELCLMTYCPVYFPWLGTWKNTKLQKRFDLGSKQFWKRPCHTWLSNVAIS